MTNEQKAAVQKAALAAARSVEQRDTPIATAIERSGVAKWFKAGAQTILENPGEWGLVGAQWKEDAIHNADTAVEIAAERNRYRGQLDKILTEYEAMKSKHNHVETWYESHIQKEKYREALEDVDRELAHEGFANSTGEGVDRARDIIKEVLKQQ